MNRSHLLILWNSYSMFTPSSNDKAIMSTNKILLYSVAISLIIHLGALSLVSLMEWRGKRHPQQVVTIDLREMFAAREKKALAPKPPAAKPRLKAVQEAKPPASSRKNFREATVDLNSREQRYKPYLKAVREKIEQSWIYPEKAEALREEGTTVIRFSLAATGEVVNAAVIRSSGSPLLDEATLLAVRTPRFAPLPANSQLSRLNIVATFEYRLAP